MPELYFMPTEQALRITLQDLQQRLTAADLPCKIEPDAPGMHWIVFDPLESTIYASTEDDYLTFATFDLVGEDDLTVLAKIESVMDAIGFSADEDAD